MNLSRGEWILTHRAVNLCSQSYLRESEMTSLAYNEPRISQFLWLHDPETDLQGFVCIIKGVVWVTIRGSNSKQDWKGNFNWLPKYGTHRGYRKSSDAVWDTVRSYCRKHIDLPVVVTGHSAGGGIAQVLGHWLAEEGHRVDLVTFGSPRAFTGRLAGKAERGFRRSFRWVNDRDAVTRVPPAWLCSFRHIGDLRLIRDDGSLSDRYRSLYGGRAKGTFKAITLQGVEAKSDHNIRKYRKAVVALEPDETVIAGGA